MYTEGADLYICSKTDSIMHTSDGGKTWNSIPRLPGRTQQLNCLVQTTNKSGVRYLVGGGNIATYRLAIDSAGARWRAVWGKLNGDDFAPPAAKFVVDKEGKYSKYKKIYLASKNGYGLWSSLDGGWHWEREYLSVGNQVEDIVLCDTLLFVRTWDGTYCSYASKPSPAVPVKRLPFAAFVFGNKIFGGDYAGKDASHPDVVVCTNNLQTVSVVNTGINLPVKSIYCTLVADNNVFLALATKYEDESTTQYGVYKFNETNTSWKEVGSSLPASHINGMAYYGSNVYVGFNNGSVYSCPLADIK